MSIHIALLTTISVFAAFTQGFCCFGYGIMAMALLSLVTAEMERATVFVSLSILVILLALMHRSSRDHPIHWGRVGLVFAGILAGSPVGYWFVLTHGRMPVFRLALGVVLILFALNGMFRPHIKRSISLGWAPLFGVLCGILSGAFSSGGPPVVIYFYSQEEDPRRAMGALQAVFLGAALYRLVVVMTMGGGVGGELLIQAAWVAPIVLLTTTFAHGLTRRVSRRTFMAIVYALVILAGLINTVRGLRGLFSA